MDGVGSSERDHDVRSPQSSSLLPRHAISKNSERLISCFADRVTNKQYDLKREGILMHSLEKEPSTKFRYLMTIADVSAYLGIDRRTLSRIRSKKQFPQPTMVGARPKWWHDEIEKWIDDGGCDPMMVQQQVTIHKRKKGRING